MKVVAKLSKSNNLKTKKCVYCGKVADTKDHIPSKNLYKGIGNLTPITVPSCKKCNEDLSTDEEYFRNLISSVQYDESLSANALFETTIKRSMRRKPSLGLAILSQMSPVELKSHSGLFMGKKTAIKMTEKDHARIYRVLDKYVRGLFYHHFEKIMPKNWAINHFWITPKNENTFLPIVKDFRWIHIKDNIFIYGFNSVPKNHQSIWCLAFFGKPFFLSFAMRSGMAERIKEKENEK